MGTVEALSHGVGRYAKEHFSESLQPTSLTKEVLA